MAAVRITPTERSAGFGYSEADLPGALANTGAAGSKTAPAAATLAPETAQGSDDTAAPADDEPADAPLSGSQPAQPSAVSAEADTEQSLVEQDYGLYEALVLLRGLYTLRPQDDEAETPADTDSAADAPRQDARRRWHHLRRG